MRRSLLRSVAATLSFRLVVVLSACILLLFAVYTTLEQRLESATTEHLVNGSAYRASDFIRQSLYAAMLRDERDRIRARIAMYGAEPGMEVIRVYDNQGQIAFSSHPREVGTRVDRQAEACSACHAAALPLRAVPTKERTRIYRKADGHRVLGLINPIPNEAACSDAACHAHPPSRSVLGVLDVQMSLADVDAEAAATRRHAMALAAGVGLLSMALFGGIVYRAVHLPTRRLRLATERLAEGDLAVEIAMDRRDELGLLAASFNRMARSLREADAEVREWSRTLEDRVREKSRELEGVQAQLVQSERAASLGRMAATVAHELNNPLSGILAHAKLAARRVANLAPDSAGRQRVLDALELIGSESRRCGNIVRDLLTYARQGKAEFRPAGLHEVVDRALQLVDHHVELRGVVTERAFALADDRLVCDPEQIEQALVALFVNAVESMDLGGRLVVRTAADAKDPARVRIEVADTGIGIAPEVLPRIFDPFFSTKEEAKGVGLGLAVVYGIVQRHEGTIEVASRPGHGTTFTITLPRRPSGLEAGGGGGGSAAPEGQG